MAADTSPATFDAVVVGAGFGGIYALYRLRALGLAVQGLEAAEDIGGTWYWNRYPGARCDVESMSYSYSFSPELEREWLWTERYATQPQILRYLQHVVERFALRPLIRFNTRLAEARWDESDGRWLLRTQTGEALCARFLVMATGCLSQPRLPPIPGLEDFRGRIYQTSRWPHDEVDFTGQRVAVVGTGSSGIQCIPLIAAQAAQLTVLQRTPNFSVPAHNAPLDPLARRALMDNYPPFRKALRESFTSLLPETAPQPSALELTPEEREQRYQAAWQEGGIKLMFCISDAILSKPANDTLASFVHARIREIVKDPNIAERLLPRDFPLGTKRLCVDTDYFATYNRPNVTLVDLRATPIVVATRNGLRTSAAEFSLDSLVFATGFDAMTGALLAIDIRGRAGLRLAEEWRNGPCTYLGIAASGFPNLFMITGPGSPSVLSNMVVSIEQHVDFIADLIDTTRRQGASAVEAQPSAQESWVAHVAEVAEGTLFPRANSWYMGSNIPGKARVFLPYVGGVGPYRKKCEEVAAAGYVGFELRA
jgi:cation diffusion facilitator CzcD-associated flavoprotein CzcO